MKKNPRLSAFIRVLKIILQKSVLICANLCLVFGFISCTKKLSPEEVAEQQKKAEEERAEAILAAKEKAISEYAASLSAEAKISQLFLVNIEGSEKYSAVEKTGSIYGKAGEGEPLVPGGVLLFSYNISKDPLETYEFIKSIRDFYLAHENPPPFVAVDQEGGYVNRLRGLTSVFWSQKQVADSFSLEGAERLYSAQARQMRNLGFHLNLAPVVEVETEKNRDFLDTRSFGNLEAVLSYGKIAVESYEKNGIAVVLKHFPGNSNADPHLGLPKIIFDDSERDNYFKPFEELLPKSSAILMSHAIMKPKSDENAEQKGGAEKYDMPACFSDYWIQKIIKNDYGFSGLVFSDDIFMGALAKNGYPPEVAAVKAVEAGIDVIMLSEKKFGSVAGILLAKAGEDENFAKEIDRAVKNVIRYKIKAGILEMIESEEANLSETETLPNAKKTAAIEQVEMTIPAFTVRVNPNYADFDLYKFDQDYKDGMKAFEMSK